MSSRASPTPSVTGVHVTPVISRTIKHSIFNPPRRRFSVPLTPQDPEMYSAVRNAIISHRIRIQKEKEKVLHSQEDHGRGEDVSPKKSVADIVFENTIQAMEKQLQIEKEAFKRAEIAVSDAQDHLLNEIKRRDERIKRTKLELETEASSLNSWKEECALLQEQLSQKKVEIQKLEAEEEAKRKLMREERKRKAQDILRKELEEREMKRMKLEEPPETSTVQKLEQELEEKRKELNELDQTRADIVWLMKQVILAEMKNKKRETAGGDSTAKNGSNKY
jgi:hypothetical protein